MEDNSNNLLVEYEQTVQTLRNWDTLFFNLASSTIIAGGVTGGVSAINGQHGLTVDRIAQIAGVIGLALAVITVLYAIFALFVAKPKFFVLQEIEEKLGMVGAYQSNTGQIRRIVLLFASLAILTIIVFSVS